MKLTTGNSKGNKGFTLAELLIVVAIIAVLVAIAVPVFNKKLEVSREAYDIHVMRAAASLAAEKYYEGAVNKEGAERAGLKWWDNHKNGDNAAGVYDPAKGRFLPLESSQYKTPYGKGTPVKTGKKYNYGDKEMYASNEDYTKGFVMIAIYPPGQNKGYDAHIDVYWKTSAKGYIGGHIKANDPKYSIRIPIDE